jgi:uncharacterized protein YdaU (DUF1376 family)|tara:strand:+ start:756 stop:1196 length:441 start_codon:yes stop_codon:yes gene_type:complete
LRTEAATYVSGFTATSEPTPLVGVEMARKRTYDTGIWMKLMIGDFLKETMPLNTETVGAYTLLSLRYWTHGPLKDAPSFLAQITKLPIERFKELQPDLAELFEINDDQWHHEGLDFLREEAAEHKRKKSEAGRKGAYAKWGKNDKD